MRSLLALLLVALALPAAASPSPDSTASPLGALLAQDRPEISRALERRREFREWNGAPSHEEAFAVYIRVAGDLVEKSGSAAARAEWHALMDLPPGGRPAEAAFGIVLRDYATHRYGADILEAARRLGRSAPLTSRAAALADSLASVHGFECARLPDDAALEVASGSGGDTLALWSRLDGEGPFAAAFFALRALRDTGVPLHSRIVLVAVPAAKSDFSAFALPGARHPLPSRNIVLDGVFPVGVAERGCVTLRVASSFKRIPLRFCQHGFKIESILGGAPGTQVPDTARAALLTIEARRGPLALATTRNRIVAFTGENPRARLSADGSGGTVTVTALGTAAHGGRPAEGQSAVLDLATFLYDLDTCTQPAHWIIGFLREFVAGETSGRGLGIAAGDSLFGRTSVNVAMIASEADSAWTLLNVFYPPGLDAAGIVRKVRARIAPYNEQYEAGLLVTPLPGGVEPARADERSPLVKALLDSYREAIGPAAGAVVNPYTSWAAAIPGAVTFGPRDPDRPTHPAAAGEDAAPDALDRLAWGTVTALLKLAVGPR